MSPQYAVAEINRMVGDFFLLVKLRARGWFASIPGMAKSTVAFFVRRGFSGQSEQHEQGVKVNLFTVNEDKGSRKRTTLFGFRLRLRQEKPHRQG